VAVVWHCGSGKSGSGRVAVAKVAVAVARMVVGIMKVAGVGEWEIGEMVGWGGNVAMWQCGNVAMWQKWQWQWQWQGGSGSGMGGSGRVAEAVARMVVAGDVEWEIG
jgi:hypothetical protein